MTRAISIAFVNGYDPERSLKILRDIETPEPEIMAPEPSDETWVRRVLLPTIARFVRSGTVPLAERIAALEQKVAALEATGIKFCGTYQRASEYRRGDVVTYDGGMWCATCDVPIQEVPGRSVAWQLSVKSGGR